MPYTRPDRSGLPDPQTPSERGSLLRSDSYLHLKDLSSLDQDEIKIDLASKTVENKVSGSSKWDKRGANLPSVLTPPVEAPNETSPSKQIQQSRTKPKRPPKPLDLANVGSNSSTKRDNVKFSPRTGASSPRVMV